MVEMDEINLIDQIMKDYDRFMEENDPAYFQLSARRIVEGMCGVICLHCTYINSKLNLEKRINALYKDKQISYDSMTNYHKIRKASNPQIHIEIGKKKNRFVISKEEIQLILEEEILKFIKRKDVQQYNYIFKKVEEQARQRSEEERKQIEKKKQLLKEEEERRAIQNKIYKYYYNVSKVLSIVWLLFIIPVFLKYRIKILTPIVGKNFIKLYLESDIITNSHMIFWCFAISLPGLAIIHFITDKLRKREIEVKDNKKNSYRNIHNFVLIVFVIISSIGAGLFLKILNKNGTMNVNPPIASNTDNGNRVTDFVNHLIDNTSSSEVNTNIENNPSRNDKYTVNTSGTDLNVRKSPAQDGEIITKIKNGISCEGTGNITEDGWLEIYIPDTEQTGWVSGQYVLTDSNETTSENNLSNNEYVDPIIQNAIDGYVPDSLNRFVLSVGERDKPGAAIWCSGGRCETYSSNSNVATVDENGVVTGISSGEAYIVFKSMSLTQCYQYIVP